jgi:hypothetical protein
MDEHRRTRNPVDIVVAKDCDAFLAFGGKHETFGRFAQAADRERIGDVGELRTKVTLRLSLIGK